MTDADLVSLTVDEERCIGVGQCELLEPDVFRVDDDSGLASALAVTVDRARAERVIEKCPSAAISVVEESDEA